MTFNQSFDRCLTFINCQINPTNQPVPKTRREPRMAVTLSRETGSGAMAIGEALAKYMQEHCPCKCPWAVFDRNLLEKILEDHHLPTRIAKFLPEDSISGINDMVDELLGLHPPAWTIVRQGTETVLHLAELGNVILIGRGATVITAKLENVFHVRLVGSLEKRIERIQASNNLTRAKALDFIRRTDQGRARFLKKYFHHKIDNPLLYDIGINTDRYSPEEAAWLIGEAVIKRREALIAKA